jgi:superoxide dismutase, Fe-Mn family
MNATPPTTLPPPMALALASNFGSVEHFVDDVVVLATATRPDPGTGRGAIRLAFDPGSGALRIDRVPDADATDALIPLLTVALPIERGEFLAELDWPLAYQRYQDAVHAASERFAARDTSGMRVLDVRRAGVFEAATAMLPEAVWHDPAAVAQWAGQLPADRPVLVYCVYGHEVGRATAMRLQALGVNARFLVGGIDAWQRAGRPTVAKPGA